MQAVRSASAEIVRRRSESVPRGVGCVHPISIVRGEGARVWDADGREYIDFVGGIGALSPLYTGSSSRSQSHTCAGTTCHGIPNRSFNQPHCDLLPPADSFSQYLSTSPYESQRTTKETASVNLNIGPPFRAMNLWPSSSKVMVRTFAGAA